MIRTGLARDSLGGRGSLGMEPYGISQVYCMYCYQVGPMFRVTRKAGARYREGGFGNRH